MTANQNNLLQASGLSLVLLEGVPATVERLSRRYRAVFDNPPSLPTTFCRTHVYFIGGAHTGLIKIGRADDVLRRMVALQLASPDVLHLLWFYLATSMHEVMLHQRFGAYRAHGEWFRPTDELIHYIDRGLPGEFPEACAA